MLRVNVGLSRKLSKDYNSTGFSINLDGEITAPVSDVEGVAAQVTELFDLAEECLLLEMERHRSDDSMGSRDEIAPDRNEQNHGRSHNPRNGNTASNGRPQGKPTSAADAATNKQINYLLNLGKRHHLTTVQLEQRIEEVLGYQVGLYDLSKKDAAKVIDVLANTETNGQAAESRRA